MKRLASHGFVHCWPSRLQLCVCVCVCVCCTRVLDLYCFVLFCAAIGVCFRYLFSLTHKSFSACHISAVSSTCHLARLSYVLLRMSYTTCTVCVGIPRVWETMCVYTMCVCVCVCVSPLFPDGVGPVVRLRRGIRRGTDRVGCGADAFHEPHGAEFRLASYDLHHEKPRHRRTSHPSRRRGRYILVYLICLHFFLLSPSSSSFFRRSFVHSFSFVLARIVPLSSPCLWVRGRLIW